MSTVWVVSGTVKDRPWMRLKDLPLSGQTAELWWRKRRLVCSEALCPRRTFTLTATAVLPRARVTERLRHRVAMAIASSNRAVSDMAREYGVSWPTAHKALVVAATRWLPESPPTSRLGIDETRFRIGSLDLGRGYLEAVRSVADQLRRLFAGWAGIAVGVGSWPHRSVCAGVAR